MALKEDALNALKNSAKRSGVFGPMVPNRRSTAVDRARLLGDVGNLTESEVQLVKKRFGRK